MMIALALMLIGALGALCARWLQSRVSQQREYLADASAVQFTRYPAGIGSALQLLATGVSSLDSGDADDYAHFTLPMAHPASRPSSPASSRPIRPSRNDRRVGGPFEYVPRQSPSPAPIGTDESSPAASASPFDVFTTTPLGAVTAVYGGLAAAGGIAAFEDTLRQSNPAIGAELGLLLPRLEAMSPLERLDLVDRCHGQLSQLSASQATEVLEVINGAIWADGRVDLDELALLRVLRRRLGKIAGSHGVRKPVSSFETELHVLFSAMAHAAGEGAELMPTVPDAKHYLRSTWLPAPVARSIEP